MIISGLFLKKIIPNIGNTFNGIFKPFTDGVVTIATKHIDSKEKRAEFEADIKQLHIDSQNRFMDWYFRDRQRATEMYGKDNSLQKIYAITFLVCFVILSIALVFSLAHIVKLPEYAIAIITMIITTFKDKIGTVTDFLFGSSKGSQEKNEVIKEFAEIETQTNKEN